MAENKKYYWLKLKENFFEEKQIKYLRKLPDGDKLVIAYLKMQLKSLKTEGFIKYDSILPSNIEELSMILDEDINIITLLISALQKVGAIEILDDGSFYMIAMQDLIGKEGQSAERVRKFRERQKEKELKMLQCNTDVTKCNTDIDINIDIDIDKNKIKKIKNPTLEEINQYIKEKELQVDGKQFYDYFSEGNWIDSKGNKVKNWKQKLLTWNKFNSQNKSKNKDYEQRQYDDLSFLYANTT